MSKNNKTFLTGCIFLIAFFLVSTEAKADQFYVTVGLQCDQKKSELTIFFKGAWNEKGKSMILQNDRNVWNTWSLVSITADSDGKYKIKENAISKVCHMKGQEYQIYILPLMAPKFHPEGNCASRMGANVILRLNEKQVMSRGIDACTETGMVTESIFVRPGKPIIYKEIQAEDFYGDK